jgi:hypothetical protein
MQRIKDGKTKSVKFLDSLFIFFDLLCMSTRKSRKKRKNKSGESKTKRRKVK